MKTRRANTILYCSNWGETVTFYRDVLDLTVELDRGWFVEFRLGENSFVSIADAERATVPSAGGAGVTLSWRVEDVADDRARLIERGVECTPITTRWGCDSTLFIDPAGNRIELWQQPADAPHTFSRP